MLDSLRFPFEVVLSVFLSLTVILSDVQEVLNEIRDDDVGQEVFGMRKFLEVRASNGRTLKPLEV